MKIVSLSGAWGGECIFSDQSGFEFAASVPGQMIVPDALYSHPVPERVHPAKVPLVHLPKLLRSLLAAADHLING